jgi:hypothetical protein
MDQTKISKENTYIQPSMFKDIFGTNPESKILELFLEMRNIQDYTPYKIAKLTCVGPQQVKRVLKKLLINNIIEIKYVHGTYEYYGLKDSSITKKLISMFDVIYRIDMGIRIDGK